MNAPNSSAPIFSLQTWRENFLRVLLQGTIIFGAVALIAVFFIYKGGGFLIGFTTAYVIILLVALVRLPYWLKAWVFASIFFLLGVSGLLETGISGSARTFFVTFAVIVGMLFPPRTAIFSALVTILTSLFAAWLVLTGQYMPARPTLLVESIDTWIVAIASIIFVDAILILGLALLQKEFLNAQERTVNVLQTLEKERVLLEKRVEERTTEITEKTIQLEAASSVARRIAEVRDLQVLLNSVVSNIAEQFGFYHVGIFLMDDKEQYAVLQAASSEGGREMLKLGHRLAVGQTGIVGYVTARARPRVALDTGADAVFFDNPHLPLTHSEMALPLIIRGHVIGALDIQSEKTNAFSEDDVEIMRTVADQLAIAIENTRLFTESEAIIGQFQALTALQTRDAWVNYLRRRAPAYQYTHLGVRPLTDVRPAESQPTESGWTLRVPIELRGQEIGVINLRRKQSSPTWNQREQELAAEIAAQVALALDTSRLLEETQKNAARDQMIASVSNRIRQTLDMETVLQTAADELRNAFGLTEAEVRFNTPLSPEVNEHSNGKRPGAQKGQD